jgi:hypothetical protein
VSRPTVRRGRGRVGHPFLKCGLEWHWNGWATRPLLTALAHAVSKKGVAQDVKVA